MAGKNLETDEEDFEDIEELELEDDIEPFDSDDDDEGLTDADLKEHKTKKDEELSAIKRQLEEERELRARRELEYQELESLALQVADQNEKLKSGALRPSKDLEKDIDEKSKLLKKAMDDGDSEAQIKLLDELDELKNIRRNAKTAPAAVQPQAQPARVHPRVSAWGQNNPWFTDPKNAVAQAATVTKSRELELRGLSPSSDEYFEAIDAMIKEKFPEVLGGKKPKKDPGMVTPVTRVSAGGGKRTTKVELTPMQLRFAKNNNIPKELLAKEILKQQARENG